MAGVQKYGLKPTGKNPKGPSLSSSTQDDARTADVKTSAPVAGKNIYLVYRSLPVVLARL